MALNPRIKVPGHAASYHLICRANGRQMKLRSADLRMKKFFMRKLKKLKELFYVRYAAWSIMDNHIHILANFKDPEDIDPKEAIKRWNDYHEEEYQYSETVKEYREYTVRHLTDVSCFMKKLNCLMTWEYKRMTGTEGTMWQRRFRSTVIERGWSVLQCASYIDLNAFRASIVSRPEEYRYTSLNYLKNGNKNGLLDIGLLEEGLDISSVYRHTGNRDDFTEEIYRAYLAYVYEAGTTAHRDELGIPEEEGLIITEEMKKSLKKYGIEPEKGSLIYRVGAYTLGKLMGCSEYTHKFYNQYINPGLTGAAAIDHKQKWVHAVGREQTGVFYKEPVFEDNKNKEERTGEKTGGRADNKASP